MSECVPIHGDYDVRGDSTDLYATDMYSVEKMNPSRSFNDLCRKVAELMRIRLSRLHSRLGELPEKLPGLARYVPKRGPEPERSASSTSSAVPEAWYQYQDRRSRTES